MIFRPISVFFSSVGPVQRHDTESAHPGLGLEVGVVRFLVRLI